MTTPPPGSRPEPSDRPDSSYPPPGYPAQSYPAPDQPAGMSGYQSYPGGADPYARYGDHHDAGPSGDDPLVPRDFGGWFQRVLGVFRRSFVTLALLSLISAVVSAVLGMVLSGLSPARPGVGGPFGASPYGLPAEPASVDSASLGGYFTALGVGLVVSALVGALVTSASIYVAVQHAAGRPAGPVEGLRFATGRMLPLFGWGAVVFLIYVGLGLAIGAANAVGAIVGGAVGAIVGGIVALAALVAFFYLAVAIISLPSVVVIERGGLSRCFALIRSRWWATFGRLLVVGIIAIVYYAVVLAIIVALSSAGAGDAISGILASALSIPFSVAAAAVIVVTYAELRSHQPDGADTATLAAQLER